MLPPSSKQFHLERASSSRRSLTSTSNSAAEKAFIRRDNRRPRMCPLEPTRKQFRKLTNSKYHDHPFHPTIKLAATLPKIVITPTPAFKNFTNGLLRRAETRLSFAKDKMLDDDRVRSLLHKARLTARRAFFNTKRTFTVIPGRLQTARLAAQRVTTNAVRKTGLQVSDDYIRGALDLLTMTVFLTLSAQAIRVSTRRYQTAADIPFRLIRKQRTIHGSIVAVRDGDTLRVRHTPLLHRVLGWYMRPRAKGISGDTINIRLAAVDAPECGKFGAPGQKYGPAARDWLKRFVGRRVAVKLHATDQYKRVVGTVWAKSDVPLLGRLGLWKRNLGLELVKAGYGTVYTGSGAVYGGIKQVYQKAEAVAKGRRVGMWIERSVETPAEYKRAMRAGLLTNGGGAKRREVPPPGKESPTAPKGLLTAFGQMYEYLRRFR